MTMICNACQDQDHRQCIDADDSLSLGRCLCQHRGSMTDEFISEYEDQAVAHAAGDHTEPQLGCLGCFPPPIQRQGCWRCAQAVAILSAQASA
jgi:hypothetical protein